MEETKCYENFPAWIPLLSTLQTLAIYVIGIYVMLQYRIIAAALYLLYILLIEYWVLKESCTKCYYYGKQCGIGKGKICTLLFKKGKTEKFAGKKITWKDLLPSFMIFLIPLLAGIPLLLQRFDWILAGLLVVLFLLATAGNGIVRGIACKYCKQRELGCPAEQMFRKK